MDLLISNNSIARSQLGDGDRAFGQDVDRPHFSPRKKTLAALRRAVNNNGRDEVDGLSSRRDWVPWPAFLRPGALPTRCRWLSIANQDQGIERQPWPRTEQTEAGLNVSIVSKQTGKWKHSRRAASVQDRPRRDTSPRRRRLSHRGPTPGRRLPGCHRRRALRLGRPGEPTYLGRSWSEPHRAKDRMKGVVFFETSGGFHHAHLVVRRPTTASLFHFILNARFLFQPHPEVCLRHLHPRPVALRGAMKVLRIGPTEADLDRVMNYVAKGLEAAIDRSDWKFLDELSPRQVWSSTRRWTFWRVASLPRESRWGVGPLPVQFYHRPSEGCCDHLGP